MNTAKPERILYVIPGLNVCGGMEAYAMNYLRHIDRERYIIDFVTHDVGADNYVDEAESYGCKVYVLPKFSPSNFSKIKPEIKRILSENDYSIIHCHMANAGGFYFSEAKRQGIPIRILHSHQSKAADTLSHALRNMPLLAWAKSLSTHFVACSHLAGDFLFGKEPYTLLRNAIEPAKYAPDEAVRERVRRELGIGEGEILVGHIGRLCPQKNQKFLLEIFSNLKALHPECRLLLVGEGEDEADLKNLAITLGIEDKVIFYGVSRKVWELYQAMDVFCMPSLYEGLSVVAVEAQAAGVPCIFSEDISKETALSPTAEFLSRENSPMEWAKRIVTLGHLEKDENPAENLKKAGYDIDVEAGKLLDYYDRLLETVKR